MSANVRTTFKNMLLYEISASLTQTGLLHWEDVYQHIKSYISEVIGKASRDDIERIWKEIVFIRKLSFAYQEKSSAYEYAPYIAVSLSAFFSEVKK